MDDEGLGFSSVLPVAEGKLGDESFEMELPPTDGLDYLRRVRLEAKSCPATVTVELQLPSQTQKLCSNVNQLSRSSAIGGNHVPQCSPAPCGYAPSLDWQKRQVADFSQLRMRLADESKVWKKVSNTKLTKLPKAGNMEGWCRLCFGRFKASLETGAEPVDAEPSSPGTTESHTTRDGGSVPLLSIIARIEQDTLLSVLEYHINWFEATGFTHHQGQWFYALLAALEKPLLPESCSLIRTLARICSNLRASLENADDVLLPQLNLLICIVGRYFEQSDMADDPS